jgi:DnaJ-class molecular chaperone
MMQQIQTMCGDCQGQGERIDPKLRCKKCNGRKVNRERKILEVQIDKGMEDGQKITFGGEGDQVHWQAFAERSNFFIYANCISLKDSTVDVQLFWMYWI